MSDELFAVAERVVASARAGEQVEAYVGRGRYTEVKVYEGEIESLSSAESQGIGVRIVIDGRQGFAYAGTLDADVIDEMLAEARDNAGFATPDEWNGLAAPDGVPVPVLDLFREGAAAFPTDRKVDLALELERLVRAGDPRILGVESAEFVDGVGEAAVVSTTGVHTHSRETSCYLAAYALAQEGDETQTGFGFSVGRHPDELDPTVAAADAVERATRLLGATKPPSERLTVVLDPWVTAQLLGILAGTLNGESVLKGRSLFAGRLGESVAATSITLVDDPTDPRAYGATETDAEGLAARRNELIADGVLQRYLHNSYTGRRSGEGTTGSAVRAGYRSTPGVGAMAVALAPGQRSQADLVADVANGVLVQEVSGLHSGVNPVSGDFSTGAQGIRIANGELTSPVREFTIASTLQKMLQDVREVGGDVTWLPMSATGVSLVVDDVTVSGS